MIPAYPSYGTERIPHRSCYPKANPRCEEQNQVHVCLHQLPTPERIPIRNKVQARETMVIHLAGLSKLLMAVRHHGGTPISNRTSSPSSKLQGSLSIHHTFSENYVLRILYGCSSIINQLVIMVQQS